VPQLTYSYDALGRRTSKTVQAVTATQYLCDGANAVQENQGGAANPILAGLGGDERFARNDVSGRTYFLPDALNSTIGLTDATGALRQQYRYDPYGNAALSDTTSRFTNPYQYTGREADSAGLYYYRARYYSPVMGGFVSEDPITFGGGQLSFYAYVSGDPMSRIDPFGLADFLDKCVGRYTVCRSSQTPNGSTPWNYVKFHFCKGVVNLGVATGDKMSSPARPVGTMDACDTEKKLCLGSLDTEDPADNPEAAKCFADELKCYSKAGGKK